MHDVGRERREAKSDVLSAAFELKFCDESSDHRAGCHSMKIVTAAEMREIDRATSERFGVPSIHLMENAGSTVARFVLSDYPHAERVGVVCGKGNNGGDGFVVARKLIEAGRAVRVLLLCGPEELRGDAAIMFQKMLGSLRPLNAAPLIVHEASGLDASAAGEIFAADVIVDAILGTGFRPPVSPLYAAAIGKMNASAALIVAVDIPSGADADAMRPRAGANDQARADAVVTFTAPRPAHIFAALTAGPTVIAPIGCFDTRAFSEYASRFCFAGCAPGTGREQGQLWTRAGDRRIAWQSGRGGDGGIFCASRGRRALDNRHA